MPPRLSDAIRASTSTPLNLWDAQTLHVERSDINRLLHFHFTGSSIVHSHGSAIDTASKSRLLSGTAILSVHRAEELKLYLACPSKSDESGAVHIFHSRYLSLTKA